MCIRDSVDSYYDLYYYSGGELRRKCVWEDPRLDGGELREEYGAPLKGEDGIETDNLDDRDRGIWQVASHLGIETDYTRINLKAYASPIGPASVWKWYNNLIKKSKK